MAQKACGSSSVADWRVVKCSRFVLYQLIFELYNFSALVPQSYIAQWVDVMLMAFLMCYGTFSALLP